MKLKKKSELQQNFLLFFTSRYRIVVHSMSIKSAELRCGGYGAFQEKTTIYFPVKLTISLGKITLWGHYRSCVNDGPLRCGLFWIYIERMFYIFMFGQHVDILVICVSTPAKLVISFSMFFCWHVSCPNYCCFTSHY